MRYIIDLKDLCESIELLQWINGSFVTRNKLRPNDIDIVTFIDSTIWHNLGDKLLPFAYPNSKQNYPGVDTYVIEKHEEESNKYSLFESDRAYWHHQFDTTRRNKEGQKAQKGFLEIIF